jgi:hypothetical protein
MSGPGINFQKYFTGVLVCACAPCVLLGCPLPERARSRLAHLTWPAYPLLATLYIACSSAAFPPVMSSADAASISAASSPSTSRSLSPSSSGTPQLDPHSELHALHSTPATHVHANAPTDTTSAVLDSRVDTLPSDVGEHAFMIIEGESQDDSPDDVGHESVDVQGREGVMVMDNGDDGQQWFPEHENHELKRVKVRLYTQVAFSAALC